MRSPNSASRPWISTHNWPATESCALPGGTRRPQEPDGTGQERDCRLSGATATHQLRRPYFYGHPALMNPQEISEIAKDGVDVQLHTHRHRTPDDEALFQREIEDNRRGIESLTGRSPRASVIRAECTGKSSFRGCRRTAYFQLPPAM